MESDLTMDPEAKAVMGYWVLQGAWILSLLGTMMLETFAVVGIASIPLGLWEIYYRHELGAYYAGTPRGLFGQRKELAHPLVRLIWGIVTLFLGLVFLLGSMLKGM